MLQFTTQIEKPTPKARCGEEENHPFYPFLVLLTGVEHL